MSTVQIYVGEHRREGFFNISPTQTNSPFIKKANEKTLSEVVIQNALDNMKKATRSQNDKPSVSAK